MGAVITFSLQIHYQNEYHPHLGEVEKAIFSEVWCALLDEGEVSEVHAQVWDAGRITTVQGITEAAESPV